MSEKYPRRCPTSAAGFFFLIVIAPPSLRIGIDGGFKKIDSRHRCPSASSSFSFLMAASVEQPEGWVAAWFRTAVRSLDVRPLKYGGQTVSFP
jgi:hypothetical protein